MEVVSVPVIVALVYGLMEVYKAIFKTEKAKSIIPLVAGVLGAVLGVVAFFVVPTLVPADNAFVSAFFGLISGLTATGSHQIVKQLVDLFSTVKKGEITDGEKNGN